MHVAGIVVEYNPFHNGHLYQVNEVKKQLGVDYVIVIMSGQFTQRGTPCITDKHTRSQMALQNGVDMVLELPVPFATSSAEYFAEAAISTLHKTGIVSKLSFGCETPNLPLLQKIALTLLDEPPEVSTSIKDFLSQGISYPRARQLALMNYLAPEVDSKDFKDLDPILSNPNNILGIEYLKALLKYHSHIEPCPLKREGANYHDEVIAHTIASATAIRNHLENMDFESIKKAMPLSASQLLIDTYSPLITLDDFSDLLHYRLIFSNLDYLYALWDIPKNLCQSLINASKVHWLISDIIQTVTSKTYSRATVSRAILRILLDVKNDFIKSLEEVNFVPYIRVLACRNDSKALLAHLCNNATVPVITQFRKAYSTASPLAQSLLDLELTASQLYALKKQNHTLSTCDFTTSIFQKK